VVNLPIVAAEEMTDTQMNTNVEMGTKEKPASKLSRVHSVHAVEDCGAAETDLHDGDAPKQRDLATSSAMAAAVVSEAPEAIAAPAAPGDATAQRTAQESWQSAITLMQDLALASAASPRAMAVLIAQANAMKLLAQHP
jgi:hypothetical protein